MSTGFLVFLSNLLFYRVSYFLSEHKPLFVSIGLYFIKRHIWRVKIFHKTIHKAWNLFNLSEQLLENSAKISVFQVSIGHMFLSIDRVLFSINQTGIEPRSRHPETPRLFSYHFQTIKPKIRPIENVEFRIFT